MVLTGLSPEGKRRDFFRLVTSKDCCEPQTPGGTRPCYFFNRLKSIATFDILITAIGNFGRQINIDRIFWTWKSNPAKAINLT
jgi:hypothetical protein